MYHQCFAPGVRSKYWFTKLQNQTKFVPCVLKKKTEWKFAREILIYRVTALEMNIFPDVNEAE